MENKKEIIRGKDLHLTEKDVYKSLSFFRKLGAFFFGGVYAIGDNELDLKDSSKNRGILLYIPPIHTRFYWKFIYRIFHKPIIKRIK